MKTIFTATIIMLVSLSMQSQITVYESKGWLESATVIWKPLSGADSYNVYYSSGNQNFLKIDNQLIRNYGGYFRADIPGLKAGTYQLKITAVTGGIESNTDIAITPEISVSARKRVGFAFANGSLPGAYKADGTLKEGAVVLYVDKNTAKTVSLDVINDKNGTKVTATGISAILTVKGRGFDRRPLSVRFIGKVGKADMDVIKDNKYFDIQGSKSLAEAKENDRGPVYYTTIEGIGDDATLYGFGINLKRTAYIEIRNLGFMLWGGGGDGDAVSMDTDNNFIWVHNNDFFYGEPGGDADQIKGDGTIDMKYNSSNVTIAFNHFWDSGKVMGIGGATGENVQLLMTIHHNWFDHADSRMPRLTFTNAHVFNNYYDGAGTYGVGTSRFSSTFVENNYFRGTYRPLLIPGQGTDVWVSGSNFSGGSFTSQEGGMTKAYNNSMNGGTSQNALSYFNQINTPVAGQIDAYEVGNPTEIVPATVAAMRGAYTYNNFDTAVGMYSYIAENPEDARNTVMNYAGRMYGGDIKYSFNNAVEDDNKAVIIALRNLLINYNTYQGEYQGTTSENEALYNPKTSILLYPNPVADYLHIATDGIVQSLEIYNTSGMLVYRSTIETDQINIEHLPAGLYLVKVKTDSGFSNQIISKLKK